LKEWTTPNFQNMPLTTNLEGEEIVEAAGKDGKTSMPEQVKRPNPWRKMMMMMVVVVGVVVVVVVVVVLVVKNVNKTRIFL
jgi:LPS O-antigen subunit length determinant protein (WzzB/FepE family)